MSVYFCSSGMKAKVGIRRSYVKLLLFITPEFVCLSFFSFSFFPNFLPSFSFFSLYYLRVGRERAGEHTPSHCFAPQMTTAAKAELGLVLGARNSIEVSHVGDKNPTP